MPSRPSVFVVDDDAAILEYYRKLFQEEDGGFDILGTTPRRAEDPVDLRLFGLPSELLAAFSAEFGAGRTIPLCILDMRMPEQSGLDVALALRAIDPQVTIVICTAYSDMTAAKLQNQLRAGVFLVHKPFAADEFRLLVHSLLREWEALQALRGNEERLRRIIEATHVGTWEWNISTGETVCNERWAEIAGYSLRDLEPVSPAIWDGLVHPEDATRCGETLARHLSGELPYYDIECRIRHRDGRWVWVQDRGQVVTRDEAGAPLHMSGTRSDISDRKSAEEMRGEMEQRLAWAFESAGEGVWDWDIRLDLVTHNALWCEILGVEEAFLRHPMSAFSDMIHEEDRPRVMAVIAACIAGEGNYASTHRMVRPDGGIIWVRDRGKVVAHDNEGRPCRLVGCMADITERRKADAELLEMKSREMRNYADELLVKVKEHTRALEQTRDALVRQEKMASIGRLASGVAHEINNPIGYIQANLSALTEYVEDFRAVIGAGDVLAGALATGNAEDIAIAASALAETRRKKDIDFLMGDIGLLVADSRKGAIRIGEIVMGLRSFARDDGGSQVPCDINGILAASLRMLGAKLKYNCVVEEDLGILRRIEGNPGQLQQVFVNLLANAGDAIAGHGTIRLRSWMDGASVRISVSDDGAGMEEETIRRIFEPFFTTKDVGKGTGLGLSISLGIIERHRGSIGVESQPGSGTTFTVTLPAAAPAEKASE